MHRPPKRSLEEEALRFLDQFASETGMGVQEARAREEQIRSHIELDGHYTHTTAELEFGARVAWRNSNRCIGRLGWMSLTVLDHRDLRAPLDIEGALRAYLRFATNGGRIRPTVAVFAPDSPESGGGPRIRNSKLVRYAGYPQGEGWLGDPAEAQFTTLCESLGWRGQRTAFDVLPVVIESPGYPQHWFEWHTSEALEVAIEHPHYPWFREMGLRWYAVPVVSDMTLEVGGIEYPAAPFNGWFMGTEVGARNLSDEGRYNVLPKVADRMGLDRADRVALWKDRALVELNTAVLHSWKKAGVRMVDHHKASEQFMRFQAREEDAGRCVMAEWAWIVPPMSGASTAVFHGGWPNEVLTPGYFYRTNPEGVPPDSCEP